MKKIIKLTESDLKHLIKESLNEYEDWKSEMLAGDANKANEMFKDKSFGKDNNIYVDQDGNKHTFSNGYAKFDMSHPELANYEVRFADVYPNGGRIRGNESLPNRDQIYHEMDFGEMEPYHESSKKNLPAGTRAFSEYIDNRNWNNSDSPENYSTSMHFKTPEMEDFYNNVGDDMNDYYSGDYKERLKQKAESLPNSEYGFMPKALSEESIHRIIKESINELREEQPYEPITSDNVTDYFPFVDDVHDYPLVTKADLESDDEQEMPEENHRPWYQDNPEEYKELF